MPTSDIHQQPWSRLTAHFERNCLFFQIVMQCLHTQNFHMTDLLAVQEA